MGKAIGLILLALVICIAAIVRLRPLAADTHHINLRELVRADDFSAGVSGHYETLSLAVNAGDIAKNIADVVEGTPRTTRLSGSLVEGGNPLVSHATYVTRSALWGFPDVTTIEVETTNMGAYVRIYGRLIYGKSDMGVNKARIEDWIDQLYALPMKDSFGNPIKRPS
ncbi:MAG: DUF1499 domain-containing protein [Litoreibacter sp.]|uniref:DUF1499 domain-containing protein n=1 Tax=Litoreibacter sp. TaxID=1969459 RepID=UPI003297AE0D